MHLNHLNVLFLHVHAFCSKIDTSVHLNLLHTNKFYQCHNAFVFPDPEPPVIKILHG